MGKIVINHMLYNNKLIGSKDNKDVILKNGSYGLYLIHDKKLYTLPKFILDKPGKKGPCVGLSRSGLFCKSVARARGACRAESPRTLANRVARRMR
jgi:hypothetical protein